MKAVERNHVVPPEELMAYLDGELEPDRALAVHDHVTDCVTCEALASDLRQVSSDMALWNAPAPARPVPLPAPPVAKRGMKPSAFAWLRRASAWQFAGAAVVVVIATAMWTQLGTARQKRSFAPGFTRLSSTPAQAEQRPAVVEGQPDYKERLETNRPRARQATAATNGQQPATAAPSRAQKVIRTVNMTIVAREFDSVRGTLDRLLRDVGGFVSVMQASGSGSERSLQATLRVPAARLDETVRALRTLGRVIDERQSGEDVTEQVRDIDARLKNSRHTEQRLAEVLRNRTGRVSDILEVEREIARVREEIERMDGQRLNLERQVEYSTVTVQVSEQRQASLDLGPTPVRTQLRNAFVEGLTNAYETLVSALVWFLSFAPFVALWTVLLWWPARIVLRTARRRTT
jgi:hypothetical protein